MTSGLNADGQLGTETPRTVMISGYKDKSLCFENFPDPTNGTATISEMILTSHIMILHLFLLPQTMGTFLVHGQVTLRKARVHILLM